MTTELATMRVSGEIDLLESQGINLVQFLAMPRALGLAIAGTGLALIFVACAFVTAVVTILLIGRTSPGPFFDSIFSSIVAADFVSLIGRSTVPAFLIGLICCHVGVNTSGSLTAIPQAVTRAMLLSVAATLLISVLFALVAYL